MSKEMNAYNAWHLFTQTERIAITKSSNDVVQDFKESIQFAGQCNLLIDFAEDGIFEVGLQYLCENTTILGANQSASETRKAAILNG